MDIRQLRQKGLYYKQIAEDLGIDPRTIAKHCGNEVEAETGPARPRILTTTWSPSLPVWARESPMRW